MLPPIDISNITKNFEESLKNKVSELQTNLLAGDFAKMEDSIRSLTQAVYKETAKAVIDSVSTSKALRFRMMEYGKAIGLTKLRVRDIYVQLGTGDIVEFKGYYAQESNLSTYCGSRHLNLAYWGCIQKASPHYYTMAGMVSVLCPSYDIGVQLVGHLGIKGTYNRFRDLSLGMSKAGRLLGIKALLGVDENLSGKRVVIEIDGGRSRIRAYNGEFSLKGNPKFDTEWREPKLFVIHVLDKEGKIARKTTLPFYGVTMGDIHVCMQELTRTLIAMGAEQAEAVQFLADGATGIWNNIKSALHNAGIAPKKIIYTLDYYHAVEHLSAMIKMLPNLSQKEQDELFKGLKDDLWNGRIYEIKRKIKLHMEDEKQSITPQLETELEYFHKHQDRMQYKKFKKKKWLCGSGLVESAIRRIINLRFKSPSSFWLPENLENLCFLRAAFLAGRWTNLTSALAQNN